MLHLRAALVASLLFNLFSFGVIVGGMVVFWHGGAVPPGQVAPRKLGGRPLFAAAAVLPPLDQARLTAALRGVNRASRPLRRDGAEARRAATTLFSARVFDRDAIGALFDRSRQDDFALRQRLEAAALDVAATLPPDERAALAQALAYSGPLHRPPS